MHSTQRLPTLPFYITYHRGNLAGCQRVLYGRGFTLFELLTAMVIIGMLGGLAVSGYQSQLTNQRADNALSDFMVFLQNARSAAIIQRTEVILCPNAGPQSFNDAAVDRITNSVRCGPRNTWGQGSVAFTDHNGDLQVNGRDKVIGLLPRDYAGIDVTWRAFRNRSYLRFKKNGLTDWQNGRFLFCSSSGDPEMTRQITINSAGRIYPSYDYDSDGVHESGNGQPIVCP
jgi:type IV fimbrial biogenesis protein FimT